MNKKATLLFLLFMAATIFAAILAANSHAIAFDGDCQEILVAKCLSIPTNGPGIAIEHFARPNVIATSEGLHPVEIEVLQMLKGKMHWHRCIIGVDYPMVPGKTYLLYAFGDDYAGGPESMATSHFMAIEVPSSVALGQSEPLSEQICQLYRESLAAAHPVN
jgi:hypothetical protein